MKLTKKYKKAQTWSFDLLIAVVLFVIVVSIFYAFLTSGESSEETENLEDQAKSLSYELNCDAQEGEHCFIAGGEINKEQLSQLYTYQDDHGYTSLQRELGVVQDFCIFFKDKEGYLIPLEIQQGSDTIYVSGIGDPNFNINEELTCFEQIGD